MQAFSSALGRKSSAVAIGAKTRAETEEEPLSVVISRAGGLVGAIVLSAAVRPDHFFVSLQRDFVDPMSVADPVSYEYDADGQVIPVVSAPTKDAKLAADGSFRFAPLDPGRHRLTIGFSVAGSSAPLVTFDDVLVLPGDDSRDSRFAVFDPRGWLRTVVIELVAADGDAVPGGTCGVTESPAVSGTALAKALRDQASDKAPPRTAFDEFLARARAAAMSITVASEWGTPFIGARFELALPVTDDFGVAVQVPGFRLARDFALGDFVQITLERTLHVTFRLDPELEELAALAPVQLQWIAIDADVLPSSNVVELPQLEDGVDTVEFAATGSWAVRACMRSSRSADHSSCIDFEPLILDESSDGATIELRRVR